MHFIGNQTKAEFSQNNINDITFCWWKYVHDVFGCWVDFSKITVGWCLEHETLVCPDLHWVETSFGNFSSVHDVYINRHRNMDVTALCIHGPSVCFTPISEIVYILLAYLTSSAQSLTVHLQPWLEPALDGFYWLSIKQIVRDYESSSSIVWTSV